MTKEYYGFIYITTNLINNKKYIGMHNNFNDDYLGSGKLLQYAIKKYGKENFSREILAYAKTKEELAKLEIYYIKIYNAILDENFYNIHSGGFGGNTIAGYNEEQLKQYKEKMSIALSGEKNLNYGKIKSKETRKKISESHKKHWRNISNEKREKFSQIMSEAVKGEKNPNYKNYWTQEQKQKLSALRIKNGKSKGKNNPMYNKKNENAINGKKVYMYNENFELIKIFNTISMALEFLNLKGHTQFNNAIKNKTLFKGYYWSKEKL